MFNKISKKNTILNWRIEIFLCLCISLFLFWGTGLHGDDFAAIFDNSFQRIKLLTVPDYFIFWWPYSLLGYDHQWCYDIIKWLVHVFSFILIYKFLLDYLPKDRAVLASLVFLFFPSHESTLYWYMTVFYVYPTAIILYSHSLVRHGKLIFAFFLLIFANFSSYVVPPFVFGLALIFLLEKRFKDTILFVLPTILYSTYYFFVSYKYPESFHDINYNITIFGFAKNIIIQFLSFVDAFIGPSFWIKIFWSIKSITLFSLFLVSVIYIFLNFKLKSKISKIPWTFIVGLLGIPLFSFLIFSSTGLYTQTVFNLGNRVTIYGALLASVLISIIPFNKKNILLLTLIIFLPIFGLSDYWKNWNVNQKNIIKKINSNEKLKQLNSEDTLLIKGNLYSKLGPFSHIELFSMPWTVDALFRKNVKTKKVIALTSYVQIEQNKIIDSKFGREVEISNQLYIYDTTEDTLKHIPKKNISAITKKKEIRHWIQLQNNFFLKSLILYLSPRLNYLFIYEK